MKWNDFPWGGNILKNYFTWRLRAIGILPKRPAEDHRLLAVRGYFFSTCAAILHTVGLFPPLANTRCAKSKQACFQKWLQEKKTKNTFVRIHIDVAIKWRNTQLRATFWDFMESSENMEDRQRERLQRCRLFLSVTKIYWFLLKFHHSEALELQFYTKHETSELSQFTRNTAVDVGSAIKPL